MNGARAKSCSRASGLLTLFPNSAPHLFTYNIAHVLQLLVSSPSLLLHCQPKQLRYRVQSFEDLRRVFCLGFSSFQASQIRNTQRPALHHIHVVTSPPLPWIPLDFLSAGIIDASLEFNFKPRVALVCSSSPWASLVLSRWPSNKQATIRLLFHYSDWIPDEWLVGSDSRHGISNTDSFSKITSPRSCE